ncbi:hypothetical protein FGO68_gene3148 [Halteria grandinella]|uniref:Uncharacterized protein n=1 Tax=Halteria grandinella TaxID=5974 RepID=A0A8J8NET7_HALGN|nr:hypothetical protein FGO68_gene3148 [Halteria grandinella]
MFPSGQNLQIKTKRQQICLQSLEFYQLLASVQQRVIGYKIQHSSLMSRRKRQSLTGIARLGHLEDCRSIQRKAQRTKKARVCNKMDKFLQMTCYLLKTIKIQKTEKKSQDILEYFQTNECIENEVI